MKITLLKWKYQIVKEKSQFGDHFNFNVYKKCHGIFSIFGFNKFVDCCIDEESAIKICEKWINYDKNKFKPEIIKEYLI